MRSVFFLAALAAPLIALADPEGSPFAELVQCQSTCTPIIKTLAACHSVASCECTQTNYDALGTCLNCFQALSSQFFLISPAQAYGDYFYDACSEFGFVLNDIVLTATPTGIASTGDPFSIFGVQTATEAVTIEADPLGLLPTQAAGSTAKTGGAVGLRTPRSLQAGAIVAVAAVAIFMGGLPL